MKKLVVFLVLGMVLLSTPAFSITQEELEEAKVTLREMQKDLRSMTTAVNIALRGKFSNINLTAGQIEELKDEYIAKKANLQTKFSELP